MPDKLKQHKPKLSYAPGHEYPFRVVKKDELFSGRLDWITMEQFKKHEDAKDYLQRVLAKGNY